MSLIHPNTTGLKTEGNVGRKYDQGKPRMDLIPPKALLEVGKVLDFGAEKQAENNWRHLQQERLIAAALRHIMHHQAGELLDSETGLQHLTHAITSLLMASELNIGQARPF